MVTPKEPETFPCIPLNGVLTERACLNNQLRALAEKAAQKFSPNVRCLTCPNPIKKLDRAYDEPKPLPPVPDMTGRLRRERKEKDQPMPKAAARVKTPPMCPQHPNEPQVIHPKGGFIGKCEICLALKPEGLPKPEPTLKTFPEPESVEPGGIVQAEFQAPPPPMCKTHPDRPAVINKKGISMGKCRECVVANGKAGGNLTKNPVIYMLRAPRHQELLKFLQEKAEENERTLEQEVVYRLKKNMS